MSRKHRFGTQHAAALKSGSASDRVNDLIAVRDHTPMASCVGSAKSNEKRCARAIEKALSRGRGESKAKSQR